MSCHDMGTSVPENGDTTTTDVYAVSAKTDTVSEDGQQVSLAINCEELKKAYDDSCASAEATFSEFAREVQASADAGASPIYAPAAALNDQFIDSAEAQRVVIIRVCIRWRWLRIYIVWKI